MSSLLKSRFPFLFDEKMPVWLTLLVSVAAALVTAAGAYWISPAINRQFQIDEARNSHLSRTTQNLNQEIIELSQKIRRLNDALVNNLETAPALRDECLDRITRLQWMLVDIRIVLTSDEDRAAVDQLANAITGVKASLDTAVDARSKPRLLASMRELGIRTRAVLDRLYDEASLK